MTRSLRLPLLGFCLALVACSSNTDPATTATTGNSTPSACATDPRAELYAVGLSSTSTDGSVKVSFVDAEPAPPARGDNTFTIALVDRNGKPIEGASIYTNALMPDHGHGSESHPAPVPMSSGRYQIGPMSLFMPGIWQVTFTVKAANGTSEDVKFTFCVDG